MPVVQGTRIWLFGWLWMAVRPQEPSDKLTACERRTTIKQLESELRDLRCKCSHEIAVPSDYFEKLAKDPWHSEEAICAGCGLDFGWVCPKSPDHKCHYSTSYDSCDYCGMPEERK